jgi:hypothetical protein
MPISIFAMLVFAIATWLGAGSVEALMRNFAAQVGVRTWVFVAVPGLFAMLFSLILFRNAAAQVQTIREAVSRSLLVGISTWLGVTAMISFLWCPGHRALRCTSDVLLVTGIVGGGPLLAAVMIAGLLVGLVLKRRVDWLTYEQPPARRVGEVIDAE